MHEQALPFSRASELENASLSFKGPGCFSDPSNGHPPPAPPRPGTRLLVLECLRACLHSEAVSAARAEPTSPSFLGLKIQGRWALGQLRAPLLFVDQMGRPSDRVAE